MKQIAQIITQLPKPPISSDMDSFDPRADAFLPAIVVLGDEVNKWAGQTNAVAQDINDANLAAQAAKEAAERAQAAAEAVTDVSLWEPGKQYDPPQCAVGSDGHTYRAVEAVTGVDPVGDTSGKWVRISAGGAAVTVFSDFTAKAGGNYLLMPGVVMTLPPSPAPYDIVTLRAAGEPWPIVRRTAGVKIKGRDSDHRVNGYAVQELVYRDGGWV